MALAQRASRTELPITLYDTVRRSLALFSRKQLQSAAWCLGPGGTARSKEAVYHFELYRCIKLIILRTESIVVKKALGIRDTIADDDCCNSQSSTSTQDAPLIPMKVMASQKLLGCRSRSSYM